MKIAAIREEFAKTGAMGFTVDEICDKIHPRFSDTPKDDLKQMIILLAHRYAIRKGERWVMK
jgi:hypothetical protein